MSWWCKQHLLFSADLFESIKFHSLWRGGLSQAVESWCLDIARNALCWEQTSWKALRIRVVQGKSSSVCRVANACHILNHFHVQQITRRASRFTVVPWGLPQNCRICTTTWRIPFWMPEYRRISLCSVILWLPILSVWVWRCVWYCGCMNEVPSTSRMCKSLAARSACLRLRRYMTIWLHALFPLYRMCLWCVWQNRSSSFRIGVCKSQILVLLRVVCITDPWGRLHSFWMVFVRNNFGASAFPISSIQDHQCICCLCLDTIPRKTSVLPHKCPLLSHPISSDFFPTWHLPSCALFNTSFLFYTVQ